MDNMNQILYIGANLHLEVLQDFPDKDFILIDSLPINEYGYDYYSRNFYRESFVVKLHEKFTELGFQLSYRIILTNNYEEIDKKHLEATMLEYINKTTNQYVHYYISTCIPLHLHNRNLFSNKTETISQLLEDIKQCDTLLICGHMPHYDILEYLSSSIVLIGYTGTVFPDISNENYILDEEDKLIEKLVKNNRISEYIVVERNSNNQKPETFQTYDLFYKNIEC
jgi:hypothetical protein